MKKFEGRVLFVGFGAVAQCTLPIFLERAKILPSQITVMDFEDKRETLKSFLAQGVTFVQDRVTQENLGTLLAKHASAGDVIVDLAWNIDCAEILQWCHDRGVLYLNTSVEVWDPYNQELYEHPTQRTLYHRHMQIRNMRSRWQDAGPTAVLEHGANPGLISHFTKFGLLQIAERALSENKLSGLGAESLKTATKNQEFHLMAQALGVKTIHCSERDTQISDVPKRVGEFVNTWSVEGFREEGTTTAEMGWGTHEKTLPALAFEHQEGPRNQICLARMGINTWVRSWVPNYEILGMVVRHGEAFTISDKLTVWEGGQAVYRPTVHYAYNPCDAALASLNELRGDNYKLQNQIRIMNDEITQGEDILGALIMGHPYQSWWVGSSLSIEASRKLVPHQNATTMQVAISVVAAVLWAIENPEKGVCVPDDLPHDFVLEMSRPYLGDFISTASEWTPLKNRQDAFQKYNGVKKDTSDPWQFSNFLVDIDS